MPLRITGVNDKGWKAKLMKIQETQLVCNLLSDWHPCHCQRRRFDAHVASEPWGRLPQDQWGNDDFSFCPAWQSKCGALSTWLHRGGKCHHVTWKRTQKRCQQALIIQTYYCTGFPCRFLVQSDRGFVEHKFRRNKCNAELRSLYIWNKHRKPAQQYFIIINNHMTA